MSRGRCFQAFLVVAVLLLVGFLPACKGKRPPKPVVAPPAVVTPPEPPTPVEPETSALTFQKDERYGRIDSIARQEMASGGLPGAVILVGNQGKVVYRKAFGYRSLVPQQQPMTENTVFDIASLTKVVATATAVMRLVDAKLIKLDDPVGKYLPEFKANGKSLITIKQLLTHTSGLRADVNPQCGWMGYEGAIAAISQDQPVRPPGSSFIYSDGNFIILAELVHRVTRTPFDAYCREKIFKPLGMRRTAFRPPGNWQPMIAPTDYQSNRLRWGEVSDPTANRMGGVAGNAGLFSTADDLAVLVQMLLNGGAIQGKRILSPQAVAAMTRPHNVPGSYVQRGLGWDLISPYSKEHNAAFPRGSFGHTGYTGTSIWVDPRSKTFLIILTSRLHPSGRGQVKQLRGRVASVVADAAKLGPPARVADWSPEEIAAAGFGASDTAGRVQPGIEVLASSDYAPLKGKRLGVITNHSGIDAARRSTVALLRRAPGVKVQAIFSPEHGLSGKLDEKVSSGLDPQSGLPVYSLYGENKKPTRETLRGLDALVYDIQDVGARFYTYITTMAYAMEAAAANGLDFYVLDRPNPITASVVQGPVMDRSMKSFIGYFPLPVRYGMTPGEVAQYYNREAGINAKLQVIPMKGYRRDAWFDQTRLPWVDPSPNLRNLTQSTLYCGVGIVESCNVSVGRGTPMPFEVLGAPWISGSRLAEYLQKRNIPGVKFQPVTFVPTSNRYCGQSCQGVSLRLTDRSNFDAPLLGVELASALHRLYPGKFHFVNTANMIGSREVVQAIKDGEDPRQISRSWQAGLNNFLQKRQKYLLY